MCRPTASELLHDPLLKKGMKTEKLVEKLLRDVVSVGAAGSSAAGGSSSSSSSAAAGSSSSSADIIGGAGAAVGSGADGRVRSTAPTETQLAPGTTWVFPEDAKEQLELGILPTHDELEDEDEGNTIDEVRSPSEEEEEAPGFGAHSLFSASSLSLSLSPMPLPLLLPFPPPLRPLQLAAQIEALGGEGGL
jgi:hypothetical protein